MKSMKKQLHTFFLSWAFLASVSAGTILCDDSTDFKFGGYNDTTNNTPANNTAANNTAANNTTANDSVLVADRGCEEIAEDPATLCVLEVDGILIEEYCPTTCSLMRNSRGCGLDDSDILVEKCVDGKWTEESCIPEPICSGGCENLNDAERASKILEVLEEVSNGTEIVDPDSHQYTAYQWIVNQDGAQVCPNDQTLVQRYVLALLYFAMGGVGWIPSAGQYLNNGPECGWFGVSCESGYVVELVLKAQNLVGPIPAEIGGLRRLRKLELDGNLITGPITESIGYLTSLTVLDLDRNLLTGTIPESLYGLKKMVWIDIDSNSIEGTVSDNISALSSLEIFSVFQNAFTGTIPESISSMNNLNALALDSNKFSGEISAKICNLKTDGSLSYISADCKDSSKITCSCCSECF